MPNHSRSGGGADIPDTIELPDAAKRAATESMVDNLGGKIIERSVNGEKQDIAVVEINGQKVRRTVKSLKSVSMKMKTVIK